MPVVLDADVCRSASVREQDRPSECLRFFVHGGDRRSKGPVRTQDADVRPTSAALTGTVDLASKSGWSGFVVASIARQALGLAVVGVVLILVSRLLAGAATGAVFSTRAVRSVRAIGWLLIGGSLAEAALGLLGSPTRLGYSFETFGTGPHLAPRGDGGIDVVQIALGALVLLIAEVFRRGAEVEAEQRLTV